jgi:hypothetical protein
MFNLIVEKHTLRFYKYKFIGLEDKPIIIEAYNKIEARQKLAYMLQLYPQLQSLAIIDESLSLPIFGETKKTIDGVECVWVGAITPSYWMPLEEFLNSNL